MGSRLWPGKCFLFEEKCFLFGLLQADPKSSLSSSVIAAWERVGNQTGPNCHVNMREFQLFDLICLYSIYWQPLPRFRTRTFKDKPLFKLMNDVLFGPSAITHVSVLPSEVSLATSAWFSLQLLCALASFGTGGTAALGGTAVRTEWCSQKSEAFFPTRFMGWTSSRSQDE